MALWKFTDDMSASTDPGSLYDTLEDLETEIWGYQEFLGDLRITYDECGDGCTVSRRAGRNIDPDYLMDLYRESPFQDDYIEQELEDAHNVQARRVRKMTRHCREMLAEKRGTREKLLEARKRLEREVAFARHPKKDETRISSCPRSIF